MRLDEKSWQDIAVDGYRGKVEFRVPMKDYTYLGIGGDAEVLTVPEDPFSLKNLLGALRKKSVPFTVIGGGTNILVRDGGIEGVVILLKVFRRMEVINESDSGVELFAEAGVPLQKLVNFCKEKGYSGLEGLSGIPGTAGGAVCGNAGSFGYEMKDAVISLAVMHGDGRLGRYKREEVGFGYRKSGITGDVIVLSANLKFGKEDAETVASRTEEFLREKRMKQPLSAKSAGCVFRNPEGLSAGRLIDEAGCKGLRMGDVEVSTVHANFFINRGKGTSSDYLGLMEKVAAITNRKSGILLEPEIRIVGRP
jgi:UDP-N-acetylmuramate dehydrogenase